MTNLQNKIKEKLLFFPVKTHEYWLLNIIKKNLTCSFAHSSTGLEDHWCGSLFSLLELAKSEAWFEDGDVTDDDTTEEFCNEGFLNWGGIIPASVGSVTKSKKKIT